MVRVYTRLDRVPQYQEKKWIEYPDMWFNENVSMGELDETCEAVLVYLEGARILDRRTGQITSWSGKKHIKYISSGTKAVICMYLWRKYGRADIVFSTLMCRPKAIPYIFDIANNTEISLVVPAANFEQGENHIFVVNDKHIAKSLSGLTHILISD